MRTMKKVIAMVMIFTLVMGLNVHFCKSTATAAQNPQSKKGIQGIDAVGNDNSELEVNHILLNLDIVDFISPTETFPVYYNGKPYYYNGIANVYQSEIARCNELGIKVTLVILLRWSSDEKLQHLIYPGGRTAGHPFYSLNTVDADAVETLEAFFDFVTKKYSDDGCYVDNWIIGNEVNMPNAYNYSGTVDLDTNIDIYAKSFKMLSDALDRNSPSAKAYISLDHSFANNDEGRGIDGKTYLNAFNQKINQLKPGAAWNVAYHPYPAIMDSTLFQHNEWISYEDTVIWPLNGKMNRFTPNNVNADFVTAANLNVMTDYIKQNFGADKRVIISEVGYDASFSEENQAAATAYMYYAAQFNDMVDAIIFNGYKDDPNDEGLLHGLYRENGTARESLDVFKHMDKTDASAHVDKYLSTMGVSSWNSLVPGYDASFFKEPEIPEDPDADVDAGYTLVLGDDNVYYASKDGVVDESPVFHVVKYNGTKFITANGRLVDYVTGLLQVGDVWYFIDRGRIISDYEGLTTYDGEFFMIKNGKLNTKANGLVDYDGGRFLVSEGHLQNTYSGLFQNSSVFQNSDGKWYFIALGQVQTQYTGLAFYDDEWFYVINGVLAENYTGNVKYDGEEFWVVNGMIKKEENN